MTCLPRIIPATLVLFLIVSCLSPAWALQPVEKVSAPPMEPGHPDCGAVSGQVVGKSGQAVAGAYVAILNAANESQVFYEGHADQNGSYAFPAVNNTLAGDSPLFLYRLFASSDDREEGYSNPFAVWDNGTAEVNVIISSNRENNPSTVGTSSGFQVVHVPMPDEVRLSAQPDTLFTGGNVSVITAQLYLNGQPYQRSGVEIAFCADNDTLGKMPAERMITTGPEGRALINLTSGNVAGNVSVTGYTHIGISRNLTGTCTVRITSPVVPETPMNSTDTVNVSAVSPANLTLENTTPDNTSAHTVQASASATPAPAPATGNVGGYALLAIALVAIAGIGAYLVAFRKR